MSDSAGGSTLTSPPESRSSSKPPRVILKLTPPRKPSRRFFVEPPTLPSAEKRQYKRVDESIFNNVFNTRVDEVIGEHTVDKTLYYYARYDGGIAYKACAQMFLHLWIPLLTRLTF